MVRSLAIQLEIYLTHLRKRSGRNSLLSESPSDFIIDPDNSTQTIDMLRSNQDDFGHTTFYLSFGVRPGRSFNSDANEYFHSNRNNPDLRKAVEDQRGILVDGTMVLVFKSTLTIQKVLIERITCILKLN